VDQAVHRGLVGKCALYVWQPAGNPRDVGIDGVIYVWLALADTLFDTYRSFFWYAYLLRPIASFAARVIASPVRTQLP
jgi:hypothetical protein